MKQLKLLFTVLFLAVLGLGNVWGADVTGTIKFGTNDVKINAASVTGNDDLENEWTITTVGTTSFTTNAAYYQVGSSNKPATSITFTTTLPASKKITAMSAKFGGFSGTAGTVTLKVGENSIGTGSLNAANDVTVTSTDATKSGTVLTVTVTGIAKGVKVYNISYTYDDGTTGGCSTPTITFAEEAVEKLTTDAAYINVASVEYESTATGQTITYSVEAGKEGVATVNATTGEVTIVGAGEAKIYASVAADGDYCEKSAYYTLKVVPTFASLEDLVAADLTAGTEVTVSFENVAIKDIYLYNGNRNGVYFDIQKEGKDIEIYFQNVPAEWVAGGKLSGTLTKCPWKVYSGTWELAPASGWAWTNLAYTAPAKHDVIWSVNGATTSEQVTEGAAITFPAKPADIEGKTFVGWVSAPIVGVQAEEPTYVTEATMGEENVTYYAVFANGTAGAGEVKTTLEYDDWTYSGTTTDKTSYRLFGDGAYVETPATINLAILTKVIVYGGTFGGAGNNGISIKDADDNVWKTGTVSGSSQTGTNEFTNGTALTGTKKLRVYATSGNGTTTGVRISKVEIFTFEGNTYSDFCTTVKPTLAVPTGLTVSNLSTTSATLSWTAVANAANYTVKIGVTEYENITETSYAATELTAATEYTWTVKANAEGYNSSAYADVKNFTTDEVVVTRYEVTLTQPEHATIAADLAEAAEGVEVTLSYSNVAEHYHFVAWTVLQGETPVTVTDNKFAMPGGDVTVTATFAEDAKHDAIFSVNGATTNVTYYEGEAISFAAPAESLIPADVVFKGWAAAAIVGTQAEAPEFVTEATMGAEDVTYFAVFATEVEGEPYWVETAIANLSSLDIFVFSNGSNAMTNNNGTSAAPGASSITVNSGKITSEVADNMKWKLSGNGTDGYVFYPYNTTTSWLYCNTTASSSSNNNLRVGTGDRKLWVVNSDNYLLTNDSYTARYLCFYSTTPDFRGYTSTSSAFVPKFYKYTTNHIYSNYCTSVVIKTLTGIEVTGTPAVLWKGDEFSHEGVTVTAKYANVEDEDVTADATFSGYDMATAGTQTVTVTYKDKEATYGITVKTIANTQENAYTTTEAIALIDAGKDLSTEVYVKGKVSDVEKFNESYNSITYWLDGKSFEVYSGKGINGADFASIDDIAVNADVIIKGIIKKFGSVYEFDKNNVLAYYKAPEIIKTNPTLTISGNKTAMSADDDDNEFTVEYNGDGEISVTSSDEAVAEAVIIDNTVIVEVKTAGTTTITISAAETATYNAVSKTYTLKVAAGLSAVALPFNFDGGKADMNVANGIKQTGLGDDYSTSPKLRFDNTNDEVVIRVAEAIKKVEYKIKGNSYTAGQFDILQSADGKTYTALKSYTDDMPSDANTPETTAKPAADTRYIKFVYTTKNAGNVALGAINITAASVVDPAELEFAKASYRFVTTDEMVVAATSKAGSTGAITYALTEGDADAFLIDENTGYIVCETAGTYTVTATIAATADYEAGSASCTVKIVEPAVANSIIVAETTDGVFAMTNTLDGSYVKSVEIKKVGDVYIVSDETYDAILYQTATDAEGKTSIVSMSNMYLQATAAKNVSYTETEYLWTLADNKLTAADAAHGTLQYNTGSPRFTTYATKVGQYATIVSLENVAKGEGVALVGNTLYATLAEAVAAANAEDEIVLLTDVNENIVVPAGKNIVLDLNEHTLNGAQAANTATIKNLGTLAVKNGTVKRAGAGSASYYIIENEGTMTLNCNVTGSASSSLIRNNAAEAKMTFVGGEYTQTGAFIVVKNDLGEVIINDGTFTTDAAKNVLNNWDQMTINGGTFNGRILSGAYDIDNTNLTINGGTFNTEAIRSYVGNGKTSGLIEIKGGEFTNASMIYVGANNTEADANIQVAISGGSFKTEIPAVYCAEGFAPKDNGDGTYGVVVKTYEEVRSSLTIGSYGTICLEQEVIEFTGATFFAVSHIVGSEIELVEVTKLVAGYPYVFVAEEKTIEVVYGTETATEAKSHNGLVGSFTRELLPAGKYIIYNDMLYATGSNNYVGANKAYFDDLSTISTVAVAAPGQALAPQRRRISTGTNTTTGMMNANESDNVSKTLINGTLYIIRGGKAFNAAGLLLK